MFPFGKRALVRFLGILVSESEDFSEKTRYMGDGARFHMPLFDGKIKF